MKDGGTNDDFIVQEMTNPAKDTDEGTQQNRRKIYNAGMYYRNKVVLPKALQEDHEQDNGNVVNIKLAAPQKGGNKSGLTNSKGQVVDSYKFPQPIISRLLDINQRPKIKIAIIGTGKVFGEDDIVLKRPYSNTLRCLERDSEAYIMPKDDFIRLFRGNENAWKIMFN